MVARPSPLEFLLLVEDIDQRSVIAALMTAQGRPTRSANATDVFIAVKGSSAEVLDPDTLQVELKAPGLRAIGIVVDADVNAHGRWSRISAFCHSNNFLEVPTSLPSNGLIVQNGDGVRFGAWIMPDNQSPGMIETFCKKILHSSSEQLWTHAVNSADASLSHGATWRSAHTDKAHIHTWMAWQDPPGRQMGTAVTRGLFDHTAENAEAFATWFNLLFSRPTRGGR